MEKIILAIIPARGGSKRIPKKNIKKLAGKPLIEYTIDAASQSKLVDKIVVSTENREIERVVRKYGVDDVLPRPKDLAGDWSRTIDVILDVLRREECEIVVCLQPTSPFRTSADIDNALAMFLENKCESVISVYECGQEQTWLLKEKGKYLIPVFGHKYFDSTLSQNLPQMYVPNGAIYIATPATLRKYKSFYTNQTLPYIMPPERSIDIDDKKDWLLAEKLLKNQK